MSIHSQRTILVATDEGFHLFNGTGTSRVDDLAGREVGRSRSAAGHSAIVEGREVWRSAEGHRSSPAATVVKRKATCLAATPGGLLVGTARVHLLRLVRDRLVGRLYSSRTGISPRCYEFAPGRYHEVGSAPKAPPTHE